MNNLQRGIYQPLADKVPIYDLADEDPEEERSRAPLLVVIALVVLAAFAGIVWLAYNQGVERGRQGASLVITAPEGPVRVAPPEAAPAPFTGLNVYNDPVSPEQEAKASTLAPQAPPPAPTEAPQIRLSQAAPPPAPAAPARPAATGAPAPAPAATRPVAATPPAPTAAPVQTAQAARPATAAPAAPATGTSRALSGAAVLQLGAFESQELANGAWASLRARFNTLGQLAPDIQRADLGAKGIVYRLRAGPFADRTAAVDACTQLKAAGGNCFVAAP
jgi:cell division septation protein DedD